MVVDCVCVCSSGALLGDLLEVNRSIDCDFLSVLFHPSFFSSVCILCANSLIFKLGLLTINRLTSP